jgi:signal transduction histidine kinase
MPPQDQPASDFAADVASVQRIDAVPAILDVVCRITGMGFAAVARVTEGRWVACAVLDKIAFGLQPGGELKVETTICNEIRQSGEPVIIDHVAQDPSFCGHPTPAMYGFQSYISMPIFRADKSFWGTLCAIDPNPHQVSLPETVQTFRLFGELIASHLDAQDRLTATDAALIGEREAAELRDQFIAVLGHDLRNPLASIQSGLSLLSRTDRDLDRPAILGAMRGSVGRMAELITNVLDFARGRLGGGVSLDLEPDARLGPALEQVVDELRAAHPTRIIETDFALDRPVAADTARISQLLSNLVGNAIVHGAKDAPVRVGAATQGGAFELSVANAGDPIPPATLARLFQPFFRGGPARPRQGLGLGLYIASEIARAHGGALSVSSTPDETVFTLRIPL